MMVHQNKDSHLVLDSTDNALQAFFEQQQYQETLIERVRQAFSASGLEITAQLTPVDIKHVQLLRQALILQKAVIQNYVYLFEVMPAPKAVYSNRFAVVSQWYTILEDINRLSQEIYTYIERAEQSSVATKLVLQRNIQQLIPILEQSINTTIVSMSTWRDLVKLYHQTLKRKS